MPIKPVDFQVMIPKTVEASKISNDDFRKNLVLQQQQASNNQKKVDNNLKQVYSQSEPQHAVIAKKQREDRENNKKNKKRNSYNKDSKKENLNNTIQTSTIDVKV